MMSLPSKEQVSLLRWVAILAGILLFTSDFGLDAWAKPVPHQAYWVIGAIAIGVDAGSMRDVVLKFLNSWASNGNNGK